MKIYIKTSEGKVLRFPLPMGIVRFGLSFSNFGIQVAKKHVNEETFKYLNAIDFKMLGNIFGDLKKYKGLALVDVKSSTGEEVRIIV